MASHDYNNGSADLDYMMTPSRSRQLKRRAESPHPDETMSKRATNEQDLPAADGGDSEDEFVDANEEIDENQLINDGGSNWEAQGFNDLVDLDESSETSNPPQMPSQSVEQSSGNHISQYGYDYGQEGEANDFADIIGPHGLGNGLTEDEIAAQGITAEQHAEEVQDDTIDVDQDAFNEFYDYEPHLQSIEEDEMPSRNAWDRMSNAEQDMILNTASGSVGSFAGDPYLAQFEQFSSSDFVRPTTISDDKNDNSAQVEDGEDEEIEPDGLSDGEHDHQVQNEHGEDEDTQLEAQEETFETGGLFGSTFGQRNQVVEVDSDIEEVDPPQVHQAVNNRAQQKSQSHPRSAIHDVDSTGGENEKALVAKSLNATPFAYVPTENKTYPTPPPGPSTPTSNGVNKTTWGTSLQRATDTNKVLIPRDLSPTLRSFYRFHNRTLYLIPRLPNWSTLPSRRYWIAVLHMGKSSENAKLSEKDFIWMKGNKFSTCSTIWHAYQTRSMCDPEDFVLVNRGEIVELGTRAEDLDWFGERLVVLRAMRKRDARKVVGEGVMVGVGKVPEKVKEVIELD